MSDIIIYDPDDVVVANRVTHYLRSVNTPNYDDVVYKLVNQSMIPVSGVPQKYWKVASETVAEMSQEEKDAVDASEPLPTPCDKEGVAEFFQESSKAIVYDTAYDHDTVNIQLTPAGNINCWWTDKSKTGFTINTSTLFTGDIYWFAKGN